MLRQLVFRPFRVASISADASACGGERRISRGSLSSRRLRCDALCGPSCSGPPSISAINCDGLEPYPHSHSLLGHVHDLEGSRAVIEVIGLKHFCKCRAQNRPAVKGGSRRHMLKRELFFLSADVAYAKFHGLNSNQSVSKGANRASRPSASGFL